MHKPGQADWQTRRLHLMKLAMARVAELQRQGTGVCDTLQQVGAEFNGRGLGMTYGKRHVLALSVGTATRYWYAWKAAHHSTGVLALRPHPVYVMRKMTPRILVAIREAALKTWLTGKPLFRHLGGRKKLGFGHRTFTRWVDKRFSSKVKEVFGDEKEAARRQSRAEWRRTEIALENAAILRNEKEAAK